MHMHILTPVAHILTRARRRYCDCSCFNDGNLPSQFASTMGTFRPTVLIRATLSVDLPALLFPHVRLSLEVS